MKKILLFILSVLVYSFSIAQSLELADLEGNAIENGAVIEAHQADLSAELISTHVLVSNVSSNDLTIKVLRTVLNEVEGSTNYYCALGLCLPPFQDELPIEYSIAANTTVPESDEFSGHYLPNGIEGSSEISYKFFNVNNPNDSVSFTVRYTAELSFELITTEGESIENGDVIYVSQENTMDEMATPDILVTNTSPNDLDIKVRRDVISEVDGTTNYFCTLGVCLPPNMDEMFESFNIKAGETVSEDMKFYAHYAPDGNAGTTIIQYKYFDVNNTVDTIAFTVHYTANEEVAEMSMQLQTMDGTQIMNGDVIEINMRDLAEEYQSENILVQNISDETVNVNVRRDEIEVVEGTVNYFCALGTCLSPDVDQLPTPYRLTAGSTVNEGNAFYAHYTPDGIAGEARIRYTYFNIDNSEDTISFELHFRDVSGINEMNVVKTPAYPNPATNWVQFDLSQFESQNAVLRIFDMSGALVLEQTVNSESTLSLNVSEFSKGVYFYRFDSKSSTSELTKLIVL